MRLSIIPAALLIASSALADTQLDRAATLCQAHMINRGATWEENSKYEPEYAAECARVFDLWHKTDTEKNLAVIRKGIADPSLSLPNNDFTNCWSTLRPL